jgi:predicted GIY-YIG superfamily endonuclease
MITLYKYKLYLIMTTVYILRLQQKPEHRTDFQDKYYVGKTNNFDKRFSDHLNGTGSEYTKLYPVIELVERFENCDAMDEVKYTLKMMKTHGIDNVRGANWCKTILDPQDIESINKIITGVEDKCYKCGNTGHFANKCKKIEQKESKENKESKDHGAYPSGCIRCGWSNHTVENCFARRDVNGKAIKVRECTRCKRSSHIEENCYATRDIRGCAIKKREEYNEEEERLPSDNEKEVSESDDEKEEEKVIFKIPPIRYEISDTVENLISTGTDMFNRIKRWWFK